MSHVVSLIVLLCLNASLFTPTFAFDLEEGDLCDLGSNVTGVCHNISKCGYGIKLLSRGIRPKLCGFEGLHAIVCCTPSEEETIRIKELQNKDTDILTDTLAATQLSQSSPVPMSDNNNNNNNQDTTTQNLTLTEIPESTSTLVYEVPVFFPISVISDPDRNKDAVTQNLTQTEIPQISPITNDNKNTTNPNITETTTKFTSILDGYIPYSSEQKCEEWYPLIFYIDILQPAGGGGGEPALKDEFKHMAAVGYGAANDIQWSCGGSLISNKFVLTAAHCLVSNYGNASWVRLGDIDISGKSNTTAIIDVPVKALYGHPDYKYPERHHDIALLELEREVEFTDNIKPACLDYFGNLSENNLTATGWGLTSFLGESSNLLLKVDLDKVPFEECQKEFQYIDNEIQLCAGGGFKKDTCQGDSGGPLQIRRKQHPTKGPIFHMIMAITSYGGPCGLSKKPGVYTRVFPHLEWIENIVWPKDR